MMKILRFDALDTYPMLRDSMFRDRARQFVERLKWDIPVTRNGLEIDQYDDEDAIYLIACNGAGEHEASMRLRPTLGRTLLEDIFPSMYRKEFRAENIWESTRFCVSPTDNGTGAVRVLLAGQALGLAQGLTGSLGIYDVRMMRVYKRLGWAPEPLDESDDPSGRIGLGMWRFSAAHLSRLSYVSGIGSRIANIWVEQANGYDPIFNLQ
ncbi:MAG: acyl-homoserine-lactone synthase [Pseudomonadota bacterium]